MRMKTNRVLALLFALLFCLAGCAEPAATSPSSSIPVESSTSLSIADLPSEPVVSDNSVAINDDITVHFLGDSLQDSLGGASTYISYARIQELDGNIYYLSVDGLTASIWCHSINRAETSLFKQFDKRISDFAFLDNGLLVANVIRPTDELNAPEPEYALGMYVYSIADDTFQPANEYYSIGSKNANFVAYTNGLIYFTIKSQDVKSLYSAHGKDVVTVFEECPSQFSVFGEYIFYLDGDTIYRHGDNPIPMIQIDAKPDLIGFSFSGDTLFLSVPEDKSGHSRYIININLSSCEVVGVVLLPTLLPRRYQADSYEIFNETWELDGEYSYVTSSHLERYNWAGELIAAYPEFSNPNYVNTNCILVIKDVLYYVAVGSGPSVLKSLSPMQ